MQINIKNVLKQQGHSMLWLSEQTGITYAAIHKICTGQTSSIKFSALESICIALQCEPGDILKLKDTTD